VSSLHVATVTHSWSLEEGANNYTCAEHSSQGHQGQVGASLPASEMWTIFSMPLAAAPRITYNSDVVELGKSCRPYGSF
jgi:hypothetical protein